MKLKFFNRPLRILLYTNGLVDLASAMLGPIYAIFVERIGGDLMDASLAGGIFALVAGVVTLLSGKYSDRIKENELILVWGYFIMGMGFLLYFFVNSVTSLFLVQAIIGLGEAIYVPAFDAVYSKHLDGHKSGTEWGAWESMNYFITSLGSIIGGILVSLFGFKIIFGIMAGLCFLSGFYIYRLERSVL